MNYPPQEEVTTGVTLYAPLSSWRKPSLWAMSPIQPDAAVQSASTPAGLLLPAAHPARTHTHTHTQSVNNSSLTPGPCAIRYSTPLNFYSSSSSIWRRRWQERTGWGSGRSRALLLEAERPSGASPGSRSRSHWAGRREKPFKCWFWRTTKTCPDYIQTRENKKSFELKLVEFDFSQLILTSTLKCIFLMFNKKEKHFTLQRTL